MKKIMQRNKWNAGNKQSFDIGQKGKTLKYCQIWGICRVQAWKIIALKRHMEEIKVEWGVESVYY